MTFKKLNVSKEFILIEIDVFNKFKHMWSLKALKNNVILNFERSVRLVIKEVIWKHQIILYLCM